MPAMTKNSQATRGESSQNRRKANFGQTFLSPAPLAPVGTNESLPAVPAPLHKDAPLAFDCAKVV
jgi:hypothetical protein